jgi:hypothetical protein
MKHVIKRFTGGLLGLLLLAGCSNALQAPQTAGEPPAEVSPAEAGTGRLTITLTGTGIDQEARTLFPSASPAFSKYELVFTPTSGQAGIPLVTLTDGATSHSLTLPTGSWTIAALAYVSIQGVPGITNGDYVAARGETTVTVSPYTTLSRTIDLRGGVDPGQGVFSYDIALPGDLDSAVLAILSLEGTPVKSVDLQSSASGVFALDSGYYLLKITRVKGGVSTARAEMVHIYANLTTEAAGPAYNFIGLGSVVEITGYLGSLPANTANAPYTLVLSGLNLEADLIKGSDPLGQLYEALDGKYVNLDLSACAGNIPNVSSGTANSRPNRDRIVSLTLSDTLTSIGDSAFRYSSSLAYIDLPDSLASIGDYAFRDCTSLAAVISRNTTPPALGGFYVFYNTSASLMIYVPGESVDAYKSAYRWSDYAGRIKPLSELPPSSGGYMGLQISFTSPAGTGITLTGGFKLSKSDSSYSSISISVENPGDYDSFRWLVDGGDLAGETGGGVTLDATDYNAGVHWLMVIAEKAGVPSSREFFFGVVD